MLYNCTDAQLADHFEVTEQTIDNWKLRHASFFESVKRGKQEADAKVVVSLHDRACGYSHPEDKIFVRDNAVGANEIITVPTIKHYPPDTAAAFIWLKNRAGWRDKMEIEGQMALNVQVIDYANAPSEGFDEEGNPI